MTDVRALLRDLADQAPTGHGERTADRVVARDGELRRRRAGWLVAVVVLVAVVLAGPFAVRALYGTSAEPATGVAAGGAAPADLYDLAPRGSLARDADLLAGALAASWDDGTPQDTGGRVLDPAPGDRRVAFLGAVPGDQVWALVLARTGGQLAYAWFADVDPSDGVTLELVDSPNRTFSDTPIGLLDTAGDRGALVVVASPGDEVDYTPDTSSAAVQPPVHRSVPTEDGVAVAEVEVPTGLGAAPGYRVARDDVVVVSQPPMLFDSTRPLGPYALPETPPVLADPTYGPLVADCLRGIGWNLTDVDGHPGPGFPLTQGAALDYLADVDRCAAEVGYQ